MWHSYHAYIHDYSALDRYLRQAFPVFVQERISPDTDWFFIRYWLGGPHIRLRIKTDRGFDAETFRAAFSDSICGFLETETVRLIDYERFYTPEMLKGEGIRQTYWKQHGSVEQIPYEPEFERYGGEGHMERSEQVFCIGSQLATKLNTMAFPYRILAAAELLYWTVRLLKQKGEAVEEDHARYAWLWSGYRPQEASAIDERLWRHIESRMGQAAASATAPQLYREYLDHVVQLADLPKGVIFSHMHMMNNRIGVHPELEHELAAFLSNSKEVLHGEG